MAASTAMRASNATKRQLFTSPAASPDPLSWRTFAILAAALVALVFAVYSPSLRFQFILDDHSFLNDPRLQSSGHIWDYFTKYVWSQFKGGPDSFYRPLFVLWLRVNIILNGPSSWWWHLLSIAKHVCVAILVGTLAWKLLRDRIAALLASTLFALHPSNTESVAWITVPDPLTSIGVLGSILFYLEYLARVEAQPPDTQKGTRKKKKKVQAKSALPWLIASALAYFAALLTKEIAVAAPAIVFVLALAFRPRLTAAPKPLSTTKEFVRRLIPALLDLAPFLLLTAVYLILRVHALGHLTANTQHLPLRTSLLTLPFAVWFYIQTVIWPVRLHAFADSIPVQAFSVRTVLLPALGIGIVVAVFVFGLWWSQRQANRSSKASQAIATRRAWLIGGLLTALPILPALDLNALNPGDFLHGRYVYLSLTGISLLLATAWHQAGRRNALLAAAGLVVVAFATLTIQQEGAWKDDVALFTIAHQIAPRNAFVAQNLVNTRVKAALDLDFAGRCDEAIPVFQDVLASYPDNWFAWAALGDCQAQMNDLAAADRSLRRAADISRDPHVEQQWQEVHARLNEAHPK